MNSYSIAFTIAIEADTHFTTTWRLDG